VTVVSLLLSLIIIGSSAVLNDVVSLPISALYTSYLICACLLLYQRSSGGVKLAHETSADQLVNTTGAPLSWGHFHIPGIWGILINALTIGYLLMGIAFSILPSTVAVTASTMNWSVVGTGGVVVLSTIYYVISAKGRYKGPIIEIA
jgi:choline transport protein